MSTIAAVEPAESTAASFASRFDPVTAATTARAGPPITGAISIGEVSTFVKRPVFATSFGMPG